MHHFTCMYQTVHETRGVSLQSHGRMSSVGSARSPELALSAFLMLALLVEASGLPFICHSDNHIGVMPIQVICPFSFYWVVCIFSY